MTTEIFRIAVDANTDLYEQDYCLWLSKTGNLLSQGNFAEIDIVNLTKEIKAMVRSEKKSVRSNLKILLMHLLKYKYQANKRTNSWLFTIREHRQRLRDSFADSPSLKRYFQEVFADCYQDARELAADETGLSLAIFSESSPFTQEEILNSDYLPIND